MKRIILVLAALFACSALFALDAQVISLTGKAQFSSNGTTWSPLAVGSAVPQGATIQTGFNSQVKLKFKGSEITLDPMTRIKVEQLSDKGNVDNAVVSMKIGSLTSNVKKLEDRRAGFTVKGPAATASVRGTILSEECGYNRDTVTARENITMVWPSSKNTESSDGADAESGQQVQDARAIAPGQASSFDNAGGERSPRGNAAESAFGMGGAPATCAMAEAVAPGAAGGSDGPGASGAAARGGSNSDITSAATTGTISVSVTFAE